MQHMPYRGNLYPDLLSEQVQVCLLTIISSRAHIGDGKLRALGFMATAKFAKFIVDEAEKWGKVGKFVGIKPA